VLTNTLGDFTVIIRQWAVVGRSHPGLIFTFDASPPRRRNTIGVDGSALQGLLRANPGGEAFADRSTGFNAADSPAFAYPWASPPSSSVTASSIPSRLSTVITMAMVSKPIRWRTLSTV
jgi:hypothetical protein